MERTVRIEVQKALLSRGFLSVADWCQERGFSRWLVYKVLEGKALNGGKSRQIVEAFREDLGIDLLKLLKSHKATSSRRFLQDKAVKTGNEDKNGERSCIRPRKGDGHRKF